MAVNYKFVDEENLKTVIGLIKQNYTTQDTTSELSNSLERETTRATNKENEILEKHDTEMGGINTRTDKIEDILKDGVGVMDVLLDNDSLIDDDKKVYLKSASEKEIESLFS